MSDYVYFTRISYWRTCPKCGNKFENVHPVGEKAECPVCMMRPKTDQKRCDT